MATNHDVRTRLRYVRLHPHVTLPEAEHHLAAAQDRLASALRSKRVDKLEVHDLNVLCEAWAQHVERLKARA